MFDGITTWVRYQTGDGLIDNQVLDLAIDTQGSVWASSFNVGISKYNGSTWRTFTYPGLTTSWVSKLAVDIDDNLWFGGTGAIKFDGTTWTNYSTDDGMLSNIVNNIVSDTLGEIWVASHDGVSRYNGTNWQTYEVIDGLPSKYIRCFAIDPATNYVWTGTSEGLAVFNRSSWSYYNTGDGLITNDVKSIEIDNNGDVWCCTASGLSVFNGSVFTNYTSADGLPVDNISDICFDNVNNAWIATWGGGVCKFNGTVLDIIDDTDGFPANYVGNVKFDNLGILWVSYNGGIARYDGINWVYYTSDDGLASNNAYQIVVDSKNNKWIGTFEGVSKMSCVAPIVDFEASVTCLPDSTDFINLTTEQDKGTQYLWDINDDGSYESSDSAYKHLFSISGSFDVRLYANNEDCFSSNSKKINISAIPIVSLSVTQDLQLCDNMTQEISASIDNFNTENNYQYIWNNGSNDSIVTVSISGDYYLDVFDSTGNCNGTSDTISIDFVKPFSSTEICMVTVDPETGKNKIIWERSLGEGIASYNIYKVFGTNYLPVGNVTSDKMSIFIDYSSSPDAVAARYGITVVDTCGNESEISPYHQTMYLGVSDGALPQTYVLDWTDYIDESGSFIPEYYYIYRGDKADNLVLYDSVSGFNTNWNDTDPGNARFYRVVVEKAVGCVPSDDTKANSGPFSRSLSNLEDNRQQSTDITTQSLGKNIEIYPNPTTDRAYITLPNTNTFYELNVYDQLGRLLDNQNNISGSEYMYECGNLPAGIYIIELKGDKISKGRLMVE